MSLYGTPRNRAEEFAELLERNYGLMLDPGRQKALCAEIEAFFGVGPMKNPARPHSGVDRSPTGTGQVVPGQFGPGNIPAPGPGQVVPGQVGPGQLPVPEQFERGRDASVQRPDGQYVPGQFEQGQLVPGQFGPGQLSVPGQPQFPGGQTQNVPLGQSAAKTVNLTPEKK